MIKTFVKHPTNNPNEIYIRDYVTSPDPSASDEDLYRMLYEDIFEDDNYSEDVVIQQKIDDNDLQNL